MMTVRLHSTRPLRVMGLGLCVAFALTHAVLAEPSHAAKKPADAQDQKPAATLPGGAQALNETFQDWQVVCAAPQGTKRCVVNQVQADSKTNQRVLAIELQPNKTGVAGVLILPFGLDLDKGVTLKTGDAQFGQTLHFKTCLPQGCVVPLSFDQKTLDALLKSAAFTVTASAVDTGRSLALQVSLKGLAPALSRVAALTE